MTVRETSSGRILVVDDVPANREILCRRLQRRGFDTVEADCGAAALSVLAGEEVDLVLLDVMMPDMSGKEVLVEIRRRWPAAEMPVIMVTAVAASADIVEALSLGANDYVTKPVDFAVALVRIQNQLARKAAESALKKANEVLEKRVEQRTSELIEANERLNREIGERRRSETAMWHAAHHDALTGLPNRKFFFEKVESELARAAAEDGRLALLCVDLDGFKVINDTLGHLTGDHFLRQVSDRLRLVAADAEAMARLGGDEFAIALRLGTGGVHRAYELAAAIRSELNRPFDLAGRSATADAGIGISVFPDHGETVEELMSAADLALYEAKAEGLGKHRLFERRMRLENEERHGKVRDLASALVDGRFELFYQPVVDLRSRRTVGLEGLIRWRHPERGIVLPSEFISLAEESDLIVAIGAWALKVACGEAVRRPDVDWIAVNISAAHFRNGRAIRDIRKAVAESGIDPRRLQIEITEHALMHHAVDVLGQLNELKQMGVGISLDDFGTGFSALGYLLTYPFDRLKIDRCFINDLTVTQRAQAITRSILDLSRGLQITAIAEGVELEAQATLLESLGCNLAQGFLFGRPIPPEPVAFAPGQIVLQNVAA